MLCSLSVLNLCTVHDFHTFLSGFVFREEWVAAIQRVSDSLAESEDVEMKVDSTGAVEANERGGLFSTVEELSAKFSEQGTSNSKSSGKKKVVSIS